jgi:hypothetical protein
MPELREVFEMTTKQMGEPDLDAWREQERRQRRSTRNRKIGAFVVVAAIGVAAVAAILGTWGEVNRTTPANEPPTVNPADAAAEKVAVGFIDAFAGFDEAKAATYLADDADLTGLIGSTAVDPGVHRPGAPADTEGLSLLLSFLQAVGYEPTVTSCDAVAYASGTGVVCDFDFHMMGSDEIGLGPFIGSSFVFMVRDGAIAQASLAWNLKEFGPQIWDPFSEWVSSTYPKDAAIMYSDGMHSAFRLSPESIRLWERHTREYVKKAGQ